MTIVIMKFGGSCLQDAEAFNKIYEITKIYENEKKIYVASAFSGITDLLLKTAYNAGTGVIEEARGQNITAKLYKYILPKLKQAGIKKSVLEVISDNTPAIKSYQKAGFKACDDLECYTGIPKNHDAPEGFTFKNLQQDEWLGFQENWNWEPTWQHVNETVIKSGDYETMGIFKDNQLFGYCTFNPKSGRIAQFCIDKNFRQKKLGSALFSMVAQTVNGKLSVINVRGTAQPSIAFLESLGLDKIIKQYGMELSIE